MVRRAKSEAGPEPPHPPNPSSPRFHLFPLLPPELRLYIWTLAIPPRLHTISTTYSCTCLPHRRHQSSLLRNITVRSSEKPSPLLSTSREPRSVYQSRTVFIPTEVPATARTNRTNKVSQHGFYLCPEKDVPYIAKRYATWRDSDLQPHNELELFAVALTSPHVRQQPTGTLAVAQIQCLALDGAIWGDAFVEAEATHIISRFQSLNSLYVIAPHLPLFYASPYLFLRLPGYLDDVVDVVRNFIPGRTVDVRGVLCGPSSDHKTPVEAVRHLQKLSTSEFERDWEERYARENTG